MHCAGSKLHGRHTRATRTPAPGAVRLLLARSVTEWRFVWECGRPGPPATGHRPPAPAQGTALPTHRPAPRGGALFPTHGAVPDFFLISVCARHGAVSVAGTPRTFKASGRRGVFVSDLRPSCSRTSVRPLSDSASREPNPAAGEALARYQNGAAPGASIHDRTRPLLNRGGFVLPVPSLPPGAAPAFLPRSPHEHRTESRADP